jgi:diguanylate cyclase (GGDEF)-like protein
VTISLGSLLVRQSKASIITLMQTRMLDIANTAAAMIDGDVLAHISPEDQGTDGYETIMKTLTYFQDNIDLKYIYHIRDMGDGTFSFGLDPTVDDPGEFGSPIVYTDALYKASKGTAAADEVPYHDAWGSFYSAYSPVLDSQGKVAGIIAVDFSAEWYNQQLATLTRTTIIVALLSLLVGGGIAFTIITRSEKKIGSIQGQLNEMAATLMHEIGNDSAAAEVNQNRLENNHSIDTLEKQIHSMQSELRTQLAHVHGQAHTDEMTGVKSKQAYLEMENKLDEELKKGELSGFAVVVCDVNGLKKINDTQGHKAGDEYIRRACTMICDVFCHSPVYRVGGDEFVAILKDRDYDNRNILIHELHQLSAAHIASNDAIVSGGLAEYENCTTSLIRIQAA